MDSNFDKVTYLADQNKDRYDEIVNSQQEVQLSELNKKLAVQREIIAEQAVKIQMLQKKLKKCGLDI